MPRIYALSDIHIDYEENRRWVDNLSLSDYTEDILILAGDVTDRIPLLVDTFESLEKRFLKILYITGNHELWLRHDNYNHSLEKFLVIQNIARDCGISMEPAHFGSLSIVPLYGWYDYSFGRPSIELQREWGDFVLCKWLSEYDEKRITQYFIFLNEAVLPVKNHTIISFSHFMPRIDLMPDYIPENKKRLYPVLGTELLEQQIRELGSEIHIYGHSHFNRRVLWENTLYINNAFGYPHETRITSKQLLCVYEF